jgi:gamma-glutamylcyclotransferase (GGCT)/AIG2-like uncharacterized protein YtfP
MHVFTYGTLMFPEVWRAVVGREFETAPATAAGFAIYYVRDAVYPGITTTNSEMAAGSKNNEAKLTKADPVLGLIYFNVDAESLARLDVFEGDDYLRQPIEVTRTGNGERLLADSYVILPTKRHLLTDEPWTAEKFATRGDLARFVARYAGFERLTGGRD